MVTVGPAPHHPKQPCPTSPLQGEPCLEDQEPHLPGATGTAFSPLPTTHSHGPCHGSHYLTTFPHGHATIIKYLPWPTPSASLQPTPQHHLHPCRHHFFHSLPPPLPLPISMLSPNTGPISPSQERVSGCSMGGQKPRAPRLPWRPPSTSRLVVDALALAAGGMGQQCGLLVV